MMRRSLNSTWFASMNDPECLWCAGQQCECVCNPDNKKRPPEGSLITPKGLEKGVKRRVTTKKPLHY